ncbi:hypothetical protein ACFWQD_03350 [Alcaligenes faecalis]|uniref:hypothetical protein n=1 Tax=Alcaligenes faecalis TaxID=511 RepID=UPI003648993A
MSKEPLFWYRPRSDGGYEGPLHSGQIEDVRKASGAWVPLFAGAAPVSAEPVGWLGVEAGNILVARRSKWINGCPDRLIALGGRTDDFILNTYVTPDDIADFEIMTAPVAAQPDLALTQQTLDDVKAGIPARDAEITALSKALETLLRSQAQPSFDDLQALAIKHGAWVPGYGPFAAELLATYGLAPEKQPHWVTGWLNAMNAVNAKAAQQPVSGAEALLVEEQLCYSGQNPSKNVGTRILPEATPAKPTEPHNGKQHQESQDCPSHQNIKDQLRHHASPVTAQVDAIIAQNIDGGAELSGKLRTVLSEGQISAAVQCLTAEVREDNGLIMLSNVSHCIRALEQAVLKKVAAQHAVTLSSIKAFFACDASAISYVSLGEYRTALLKMLRQALAEKEPGA